MLGIATIIYTGLSFYIWKKAYKKGAKDLFALFMVDFYQQKVNAFKIQNKHAKKRGITFIGDSITQDYPLQDFYSEFITYNRGIGGDTTLGLSNRLNESVFELDPQVVVILIGTNDLSLTQDSLEAIIGRIEEIVQTILESISNIQIILQSIYPINHTINPASVGPRTNQDIQIINQGISKIKNVHFVDIYFELINKDGLLDPKWSYDGLHLSALGYEKITSILLPILSKLIKKD